MSLYEGFKFCVGLFHPEGAGSKLEEADLVGVPQVALGSFKHAYTMVCKYAPSPCAEDQAPPGESSLQSSRGATRGGEELSFHSSVAVFLLRCSLGCCRPLTGFLS